MADECDRCSRLEAQVDQLETENDELNRQFEEMREERDLAQCETAALRDTPYLRLA